MSPRRWDRKSRRGRRGPRDDARQLRLFHPEELEILGELEERYNSALPLTDELIAQLAGVGVGAVVDLEEMRALGLRWHPERRSFVGPVEIGPE